MKLKTNKSHLIYMRFRKLKCGSSSLFKKLRDFILCCKKTINEVDSVLEDINDLQLFADPKKNDS